MRRVHFIEQGEHSECGLACAAMVADASGARTSMEDLRARYGAPRGGLSIGQVRTVLTDLGVAVRGVRAPSVEAMAGLTMPCVLHWDDRHFVVLERVAHGRFHVIDPANGRHTYDSGQMAEHCSGVLLEPTGKMRGMPATQRLRRNAMFDILRQFVSVHPWISAATLLLAFAVQGITLIVPTGTRYLIDHRSVVEDGGFMGLTVSALLASVLVYYLVSALNTLVLTRLQVEFGRYLFGRYMSGALGRDFSFFVNRSSGDMIYRANLVMVVEQMLTGGLTTTLISFVFLVVYLVMMFAYSVPLTLMTLGVCALVLSVSVVYARCNRRLTDLETAAQSDVQRSFIEIFSGIETVKSLNLENEFYDRWNESFERQLDYQGARGRLGAGLSSLSAALVFVLPLCVVSFGVSLVAGGRIGLGTVVGFMTLASSFASPFSGIVTAIGQFAAVGSYIRKICEIIPDRLPEINGHEAFGLVSKRGLDSIEHMESLSARGVAYAYTAFEPPVVHDIDLDIRLGDKIAIVGATGSGKSTLLKMLAGLVPPTSGRVLVNGQLPISEMGGWWKMPRIAFVNQNAVVFNGTLRANIKLERPWVDDERIREACRKTCIDDRMMNPAAGLDTMISENGMNLSGGQRQKIAIARALVNDPGFLLMDEPTSALDNGTERRIIRAILDSPSACVVVAHRLASIRDFDRIIVMDRGTIVESGTHDELMRAGGVYAGLYGDVDRRDRAVTT